METPPKRLIIGSDHAAVDLKGKIVSFLSELSISTHDAGPFTGDSVDYPDFAAQVARGVSSGEYDGGILMCGTGLGMSMAANRHPHVRAALCGDMFSAIMSRQHNDANVLVMGARVIGEALALEIVRTWLETPFEGGRHQTRIDKFDQIPMGCCADSKEK
jgi:ribose 5-phosphate isomerase B